MFFYRIILLLLLLLCLFYYHYYIAIIITIISLRRSLSGLEKVFVTMVKPALYLGDLIIIAIILPVTTIIVIYDYYYYYYYCDYYNINYYYCHHPCDNRHVRLSRGMRESSRLPIAVPGHDVEDILFLSLSLPQSLSAAVSLRFSFRSSSPSGLFL